MRRNRARPGRNLINVFWTCTFTTFPSHKELCSKRTASLDSQHTSNLVLNNAYTAVPVPLHRTPHSRPNKQKPREPSSHALNPYPPTTSNGKRTSQKKYSKTVALELPCLILKRPHRHPSPPDFKFRTSKTSCSRNAFVPGECKTRDDNLVI